MSAQKLAMRNVQTPDRPSLEMQSAMRQTARVVNGLLRCVAIEAYADTGDWFNTLQATSSATLVDSAETLTLATQVQPKDVLVINGRAVVGTDATPTLAAQLIVYEASRATSTTKPETLWETPPNVGSVLVPFNCKHTVTKAGTCTVTLQFSATGGGNVYLFTRGAFVVEVWRP